MKKFLMLCGVLLLVISCSDQAQQISAPEPLMPPGILSVVDSIGVEIGDSLYMFGSIEDLVIMDDGSIVLLDRAFSRVMVYDGQGNFIRQIGREGDGPGEMSLTIFMVVTGGGDLLVSQRDAMERFDFYTGEWIGEYPRGLTPPPLVLAGMKDSSFVAVHFQMLPENDRLMAAVTLGVYLPGRDQPEIVLHENSFEFLPTNAALLFENVFDAYFVTVDDFQTVYFARRSAEEYMIVGFNLEGEKVFELSRDDLNPIEKTTEELEEDTRYMEARFTSMGAGEQDCTPDPFYPMISELGIDADGNIWARRGGERIPTFDVYSADGELLREVSLQVDPAEGRFWRVIIDNEGALAYSEDPASGYQKVYILRLPE